MPADLFRLDGRVALVTGSARGLGAAAALALAEAGADVALHTHATSAAETERAIRDTTTSKTVVLTGDLGDRATSDRLVGEAVTHFGRLDILVNNAGTIRRTPAAEYSDEDWDAVLEVNLTSVFRQSARPDEFF